MGVATGCGCEEVYRFPHTTYERVVDLEVEGVRYIEMHREPATYILGPPPSRGRDLELEGGVNACYVYERAPRLPRARYRVMAS